MSFNLVDLVKGQLGGPALGQLGALLGEDNAKTEAAVGAAVPGLLSGLTSAANADGGASLFNAVQDSDDSILDNIGGLLTGGNSSSVMNQGSGLLSSILGNGAAGGLASAVSGLTGIGGKSSSGLMGMLMPIVLGIVKRKIFGGGGGIAQNAGGLLSMLNGQKDNVQAAMPAGFQNQLQSSGFMDQLSNLGSGAAGAVGGAANAVGDAAGNVASGVGNAAGNVADGVGNVAGGVGNAAGDAVSGGGGFLKKFLPIAALVALAVVGWRMFSGGGAEMPDVDVNAPSVEMPKIDMPGLPEIPEIGGLNVGDELSGIFGGATSAISGITDEASATAAVPTLEGISGRVDGLSGIMDKIPGDAQGPVKSIIGDNVGKLTPLLEKANELPGVGGVLGPIMGPMMEKLQGMM